MKYMNKLESLETAYRKEHADVAMRMIAVLMILKNGKDVQTVAKIHVIAQTGCVNGLVVLRSMVLMVSTIYQEAVDQD